MSVDSLKGALGEKRHREPISTAIFRTCGACREPYTRAEFDRLKYGGQQPDGDKSLILRNCPCGNTMGAWDNA